MDYTSSPHLIKIFDFGTLHLELNTPVFIFSLVMVVLVLVNWLLIGPVMRTVRARADQAKASADKTADMLARAQTMRQEYQDKLNKARGEVTQARIDGRKEAGKATEDILSKAKTSADAELKIQMEAMRSDISATQGELKAKVPALAGQIATRLLA